jgi:hypothetical protein
MRPDDFGTLLITLAALSLIGSDTVNYVFGWVWPPVLLGLVVWIFIRVRRQLHSRTGTLFPVASIAFGV